VADDLETISFESFGDEIALDSLGTALAELEVVVHRPCGVGVSGDLDPPRVGPEDRDNAIEHPATVRRQVRPVNLKLDHFPVELVVETRLQGLPRGRRLTDRQPIDNLETRQESDRTAKDADPGEFAEHRATDDGLTAGELDVEVPPRVVEGG
jgi:hypothetical protein